MGEVGWTMQAGRTLQALREARQLTQQELAQRVGLSSGVVVAALEAADKIPSLKRAGELALALGVTLSELMGETPRTSPAHIHNEVSGTVHVMQIIDGRYYGLETEEGVSRLKDILHDAMQDLVRLLQTVRPGHDGPQPE